ncbi:MAG: mechanosensitive ion channel family protein [Candidatus ainarchaeum sp.]|nr:mechanosensitive ion channel family protein [Candidatus ainarchaeum sp.]
MTPEAVLLAVLATPPLKWLLFFACVIVSIMLGKLVDFIIGRWVRVLAKRNPLGPRHLNEIIFRILEKPLWLIFVVIGFLIGLGFLNLPAETLRLVNQTIVVVVILIITWIIVRTVDFVLKGYLAPIAKNAGAKIDEQFLPILSKIIKIIVIVIAIAAIGGSLGYDLTAVFAGLGIGGLAIAFAAQATIADVFGGFSIFTSKHYAVGDVIDYEDEVFGLQVEQIGLRYTYFRDYNGRRVIIPNSKIASMPITNISSEKKIRTVLNLVLGFDTSMKKIDRAKKIIREVIENEKSCDKNPEISFSDFKECGINIQAAYYINDKKKFSQARDSVNSRIKNCFDKEKIFFALQGRAASSQADFGVGANVQKKIIDN